MARLAGVIYKKGTSNENSVFYRTRVLEILEILRRSGSSYRLLDEIINKEFNISAGIQSKYNLSKYLKNAQKEIKAGKPFTYIDGKIYNLSVLYNKYSSRFAERITNEHDRLQKLLDFFGIEIVKEFKGPFAILFTDRNGDIFLTRDFLGRKPLYYSLDQKSGNLHFASEIKSLVQFCPEICELPPGSFIKNLSSPVIIKDIGSSITDYNCETDSNKQMVLGSQDSIVKELESLFFKSVEKRLSGKKPNHKVGVWLSGGMDSSIIAAAAREFTDNIFTFSVGFEKSKDIEAARTVANLLGTTHVEFLLSTDYLFKMIPKTIYTLESFDAPLVRSTLGNLIASELSSGCDLVFSGEGGDEVFAGYRHFLDMDSDLSIQNGLINSLKSLHNTALQRVDRSANLFNVNVKLPFLDEDLMDFSLSIPPEHKISHKEKSTKHILRLMASKYLPDSIVWRPKDKFWEGSGILDCLKQKIDEEISDREFISQKSLKDGFIMRNKEEYYYYKTFMDFFPGIDYNNFLSFTENFN